MSFKQFEKAYEPHEVEKRWYKYWEREQLFAADEQSRQTSYSIVILHGIIQCVPHMKNARYIGRRDDN